MVEATYARHGDKVRWWSLGAFCHLRKPWMRREGWFVSCGFRNQSWGQWVELSLKRSSARIKEASQAAGSSSANDRLPPEVGAPMDYCSHSSSQM